MPSPSVVNAPSPAPRMATRPAQPVGLPAPATEAPVAPAVSDQGIVPRNEEILAYVGPEVILMGDVLPEAEHAIQQWLKGKPKPTESEMEQLRITVIRGRLKSAIELRQLLVYAKQEIKDDEKYREVRKNVAEQFEKKRVKQLVTELAEKGVANRADLERRSEELFGVPFARFREAFVDQSIAWGFVNQKLPKEEEVSHADALAYYQAHESEYEFPAKARWEQITVKYGPGKRTREEAWRIIAQGANAIIGGARFDAVARQLSEDPLSAKNGGLQDWIGQGSLVSEKLDAALFDTRAAVGTLRHVEDDGAFHLIRVVERRSAGKTSFAEAQSQIKEKLKKERQDANRRELVEKIRQQIPVRNVFEERHPAPPPRPKRSEAD